MSFAANLPLFSIVACLMCAVVSSVLPSRVANGLTRLLALAVTAAAGFVLALGVRTGQTTLYTMGHFPHPWGNELRFGILEPLFAGAFACVLLLCVAGGDRELGRDVDIRRRNLYFVMADLVLAALLSLCYTNDIFTGYVFIEICTIASCGLLMIRSIGRTTLAATRYMIFSLVGSGLFLLGVIFLYAQTGHLLFPELREGVAALWRSGEGRWPLTVSMGLITLGLGIKSGMFPFYFWMPDTYGWATPASAGILSGLISKGYLFLLMKLICGVFGAEIFHAGGLGPLVFALGLAGMLLGSVGAMGEKDVFRMLAFSSAAQIGYIYLGLGLSPALGLLAALFQILCHALTKPALFLAASRLSGAAGEARRFRELQGTARADRSAGLLFTLGALSMIGVPGTMGFLVKFSFARAALAGGWQLWPAIMGLAFSTVLNTCYFGRTVLRIYARPEAAATLAPVREGRTSFLAAAGLLLAANLAVGLHAQPLLDLLERGVALFGA